MAKLIKPLTATQVNNAKATENMYKMFDGGGLFLQVNPSGGKHWKMKYRKADGKEGLLTFGSYPAVTLEQARKKRDEARARKAAGIDPGEAKRREEDERRNASKNTFEAVARAWMEVYATRVKAGTLSAINSALEKYIFPFIGKMPVRNLKAADFLVCYRKLEALPYKGIASFACRTCGMVMRFAVATGQADSDPMPSLRGSLKTYKKKHNAAITDPKLVGQLLRAIDGYPGTFYVISALKLLAYTFVRPGELRQAKWADIDFDTCEWRYTTEKTDTPHIVPLAPQVIAILRVLHDMSGQGQWVFMNQWSKSNPMGRSSMVSALRGMGFGTDDMTPHGFRAIARTLLDEVLGERYDLIEHQLAHVVRDPNGRAYNRTVHLPERKRMMCRWADYLDSLRDQVE